MLSKSNFYRAVSEGSVCCESATLSNEGQIHAWIHVCVVEIYILYSGNRKELDSGALKLLEFLIIYQIPAFQTGQIPAGM